MRTPCTEGLWCTWLVPGSGVVEVCVEKTTGTTMYRVRYEDGDCEDMYMEELREVLVTKDRVEQSGSEETEQPWELEMLGQEG